MNPVRNQPTLFVNTDAPTGSSPDYIFEVPESATCCPTECWERIVSETDSIDFQFHAPSCDTEAQIISNSDFSDPDEGSTSQVDWGGTVDVFNIGGSGARFDYDGVYIEQSNANIVQGNWYRLQVSVNVISATESKPSNLIVTGFEQETIIPAADGLYELYVQASAGEQIRVTHQQIAASDDLLYVRWVNLYEITEPEIIALDIEGNQISTNASAIIRDGELIDVTFFLNTQEQDEGNIRIGVYRACDGDAWISEPIRLVSDVSCMIQIGGCGDSNFQIGDLSMRLSGFITQDQAPEFDRFITQDSKGRYRNNYTKMNRLWTLYIEIIPPHVRDWINWLTGYNTIAVKEEGGLSLEYFVLKEPEAPNFADRMYGLGKMKLTLARKEELNESIYQGDCTVVLPPKGLGKRNNSDGGGILIKTDTNEGINAE